MCSIVLSFYDGLTRIFLEYGHNSYVIIPFLGSCCASAEVVVNERFCLYYNKKWGHMNPSFLNSASLFDVILKFQSQEYFWLN